MAKILIDGLQSSRYVFIVLYICAYAHKSSYHHNKTTTTPQPFRTNHLFELSVCFIHDWYTKATLLYILDNNMPSTIYGVVCGGRALQQEKKLRLCVCGQLFLFPVAFNLFFFSIHKSTVNTGFDHEGQISGLTLNASRILYCEIRPTTLQS